MATTRHDRLTTGPRNSQRVVNPFRRLAGASLIPTLVLCADALAGPTAEGIAPGALAVTGAGTTSWPWITTLGLLTLGVAVAHVRIAAARRRGAASGRSCGGNARLAARMRLCTWCVLACAALTFLTLIWPSHLLLAVMLAVANVLSWRLALDHSRGCVPEGSIEPQRSVGGGADARIVELERLVAEQAEQLEHARGVAQRAMRAKSAFLSNMSHEIRTPMTAIRGYADLIDDAELSPEERSQLIRAIRRNGDHLLGLINDVLDLSRIEAGELVLEPRQCSPIDVAQDALSTVRLRAAETGLRLATRYSYPLPLLIETDPIRLRQILTNLLSNAVKFTQSGSVTLAVHADRADGKIVFDVVDTGIGLSLEQAALLFRPFAQADSSSTRRYGGTGLGLTISQNLARMLGGEITVCSQRGSGSTFTLSIPVSSTAAWLEAAPPSPAAVTTVTAQPAQTNAAPSARAPADSAATRREGPLSGRRVLLAEDGLDNQRLLTLILEKHGAAVELAPNGLEAVNAVTAAPERFDLILMDMQMPMLDGYGATSRLRAMGYSRPIIAVTANAMTGDREKCLAAGCSHYLTKPIDRELLIETCQALARACQAA